MAKAFDVALEVRFVPFSRLVDWVSGTPYFENGLSSDALNVPSFEEKKKQRMFENKVSVTVTSFRIPEGNTFGDWLPVERHADVKIGNWILGSKTHPVADSITSS